MMGAIIRFPIQGEHYREAAAQLAPTLETEWADRHMPLLAVALDLLELSDDELFERVQLMREASNLSLIRELVDELRGAGTALEAVYRAIYLTQTRLQAALTSPLTEGGAS